VFVLVCEPRAPSDDADDDDGYDDDDYDGSRVRLNPFRWNRAAHVMYLEVRRFNWTETC
jgi:hypothetical protein